MNIVQSDRQKILSLLQTDLLKIQESNNYNVSIKKVHNGILLLDEVSTDLPLACIFFNDEVREQIGEPVDIFKGDAELICLVHCEVKPNSSLSINEYCEGVVTDLLHYFNKHKSKTDVCDFNILQTPMNWFVSRINSRLDGNTDYTKQTVAVGVRIIYKDWFKIGTEIQSQLPDAPILQSPVNGGFADSIYPQFDWSEASRAISYHFQISVDPSFPANNTFTQEFLFTTSFTIPLGNALLTQTVYYWRVRGYSKYGYGEWSAVWSFQIGDELSLAQLAFWGDSTQGIVLNGSNIRRWNSIQSLSSWFGQPVASKQPIQNIDGTFSLDITDDELLEADSASPQAGNMFWQTFTTGYTILVWEKIDTPANGYVGYTGFNGYSNGMNRYTSLKIYQNFIYLLGGAIRSANISVDNIVTDFDNWCLNVQVWDKINLYHYTYDKTKRLLLQGVREATTSSTHTNNYQSVIVIPRGRRTRYMVIFKRGLSQAEVGKFFDLTVGNVP